MSNPPPLRRPPPPSRVRVHVYIRTRPPATLPRLVDDPIPPPRRDGSPHPRTRHQRRVAPPIHAALVKVKVEVAQLALELLFHALPHLLGALVVLEEEGEFFERAPVGFGEHEVLGRLLARRKGGTKKGGVR